MDNHDKYCTYYFIQALISVCSVLFHKHTKRVSVLVESHQCVTMNGSLSLVKVICFLDKNKTK